MRVVIAGTRTSLPGDIVADLVIRAVEASGFGVTEVVSGHAAGIDLAGEAWASANQVPVLLMPARFKYGPTAALVRNECMLDIADGLIAIWDGKSKGTNHIINAARARGMKLCIFGLRP